MAIAYVVLGVVAKNRDHFPATFGLIYLAGAFGLPLLLYVWCRSEIEDRHFPYPSGAPLLVAWIFPIGLPVYFFRTRPWPKALLALGCAVGFIVACELAVAGIQRIYAHIT
jgi:hypothetical protein